ncbi:MAG: PepSY-like domain-containing protein [Saprospiraceae bacterium]|nr:PepSY-like domain-containing protein [Saprospiraceae bacterium]
MKTITIIKGTIILFILVVSKTSFAQSKIIPYNQTSNKIQDYIKTHFSKSEVVQASVEKEGLSKEYEIILADGIKLEFNSKYKIREIDGKSKLPDSVIPQKIREYVVRNFSKNVITDWKIDGKNQQIGLDNDLDLEFSMGGKFLRIDK